MTETPEDDDQSVARRQDQPQPPPLPPVYGAPPPTGYGQPPPGQGTPPPYGTPPPSGYGQPQPGYGPPPGYGQSPTATFGFDPMTGLPYSDKSKMAAGLLQLLLPCVGVCGVGRLMTGHLAIGLIQLIGLWAGWMLLLFGPGILMVPAIWIWSVVDGILILSGSVKDSDGRPLRP